MIYIIYNDIGCLVSLVAVVFGLTAFGVSRLFTSGPLADEIGAVAVGLILLVMDLTGRIIGVRKNGWVDLVGPRGGGHLFFIPCWLIGILICYSFIRGWLWPVAPG